MFQKILTGLAAILAAIAGFYKWRADRNEEKARRQRVRAEGLETKARVQKSVREGQNAAAERADKETDNFDRARRDKGLDKWAIVFVILLAGCASQPVVQPVPCSAPSRPTLPTVTGSELAPLTDDVYDKVIRRDIRLREYAEKLEAACDAINAEIERQGANSD